MNHRVLVFLLTIPCVLAFPAQADVACMEWSCNPATGSCSFDARCSYANPYIYKYLFTWGDGSSTGLTGSPLQTHTYSLSGNGCVATATCTC